MQLVDVMQFKPEPGIYCIENLTTHKKYVGQAINVRERWGEHVSDLYHQTHFNTYLQHAWNKYGEDDFNYYVLEYCSREELDERETYYIDTFDLLNRDLGYNRKRGGQHGGGTFSKEAKEKLSESIKASYTDELREKRSQQLKAIWDNPEERAKRIGESHPMYGYHHTDEVKKRLSELHKGISVNVKYPYKVLCVEKNQIFENARVAAKELSLDSSCIVKVCKGERYMCGGYHWQFIIDENNWENKVS